MKLKRFLYTIVSFCLLAAMLPTFSGCNSGSADTEAPTAPPASETVKPTENHTDKQTSKPTEVPREEVSYLESLIVAKSQRLRDPCVLLHDGKYYMYGTTWKYCVSDSLTGQFSDLKSCVKTPDDYAGDPWAPEVHKYNGKFYMFTTYRSTKNDRRGCAIFVSDTPEGPFTLHSDGHITPSDWDAIDGTFYVDEEGQPWMVFVHEWTSTSDGIGTMACAKLSDDLTHFISEPVELFGARDAEWVSSSSVVTDGCYMYMTEKGELLMIWSNWDPYGYAVGIARSTSGNILGPWTQDEFTLYSKEYTDQYDGGHGMLFKDEEGQLWMSIHSPNDSAVGRLETPVFVPIIEEYGTIYWDLYKRN